MSSDCNNPGLCFVHLKRNNLIHPPDFRRYVYFVYRLNINIHEDNCLTAILEPHCRYVTNGKVLPSKDNKSGSYARCLTFTHFYRHFKVTSVMSNIRYIPLIVADKVKKREIQSGK